MDACISKVNSLVIDPQASDPVLYSYSPLPTTSSIRLVRRLGTDHEGVFSISLETVDLESPIKLSPYISDEEGRTPRPRFHCLSYTWGNPHTNGRGFEEEFAAREAEYSFDSTVPIKCNGKILHIRKNLHQFLTQAPTHWITRIRNRPYPDTGKTRLHDAAAQDNHQMVHLHLCEGANVDAKDNLGQTPLHVSAGHGHFENVRVLLRGGASITTKNQAGHTPKNLAAANGHNRIVDLFDMCETSGADNTVSDIPPIDKLNADECIWIDAICIDQFNLDERAAQVRIMSAIYSSAAYVIAWLGPEDQYTDAAISTIAKIKESADELMDSDLTPYRTESPEDYARNSVPYISDQDWRALAALFLRQWFRRMWIIQEIVFSLSTIVYCGNKTINWSDLELVSGVLLQKSRVLGFRPSDIYVPVHDIAAGVEWSFAVINMLRNILRDNWESEKTGNLDRFKLEKLVIAFWHFSATDPRDKIYALVPLAQLNPDRRHIIQVDYKISVEECYANFTKELIREKGNVDALGFVQDTSIKAISGLPSWVPDYSVSGTNPFGDLGFCAFGKLNGGKASFSMELGWNKLIVTGLRFDKIEKTAAPRPFMGANKKFEIDGSWFDLFVGLERNDRYTKMNQSLVEVLWRTLCADTDLELKTPAPKEYGQLFKLLLCAMICAEPELKTQEEEMNRGNAISLFEQSEMASMAVSDPVLAAVIDATPGYRERRKNDLRQKWPAPERNIQSKHFDCVREILKMIQRLRKITEDDDLPSESEVDSYFKSAKMPLTNPNGYTVISLEIEPYALAHQNVYGRRRLFRTEKGFIGLGPASLEEGDVIYLVPGFSQPVVLRQLQEDFKDVLWSVRQINKDTKSVRAMYSHNFVGDAYIHGLMNGEGVEEDSDEDLTNVILV